MYWYAEWACTIRIVWEQVNVKVFYGVKLVNIQSYLEVFDSCIIN